MLSVPVCQHSAGRARHKRPMGAKAGERPAGLSSPRCVTMQLAVLLTRPLQNHLPLEMHFTTQAGLWIPQYLQRAGPSKATSCGVARHAAGIAVGQAASF
jgi:hypothetical protein